MNTPYSPKPILGLFFTLEMIGVSSTPGYLEKYTWFLHLGRGPVKGDHKQIIQAVLYSHTKWVSMSVCVIVIIYVIRIHTTRVVKANNIKDTRFQNMKNVRFRPIIPLATAPIKVNINAQYPLWLMAGWVGGGGWGALWINDVTDLLNDIHIHREYINDKYLISLVKNLASKWLTF